MTQLSNFILKSRNNYNEDYICKYISEDVARESIKNHEIWMRKDKILMMRENKRLFRSYLKIHHGLR